MKWVFSISFCLVLFGISPPASSNVSVPLDFPSFVINTSGSPDSGNYFLASLAAADATTSSYVIIADNNAEPLFYWHWNKGIFCVKVQPAGQLTFGTRLSGNNVSWLIMDETYAFQDTFSIIGNTTDIHDFTIMSDGNSILMSYEERYIDMSQIVPDGDPNALVIGLFLQEQDQNHNVIFEWSSFDYFEITDATQYVNLEAAVIDYVHCNSIAEDTDGNILLSCLAMCQCVKIDRTTGDIIWRLGGLDADTSSFTMVGDPLGGFSSHHDFQSSGTNTYTIFDNGRFHSPQISRALEYELDIDSMTATLVWSHQESDLYGSHLGSVQKLPGGNYVIGWGDIVGITTHPDVTEIHEDGSGEHSFRFVDPIFESYRAYKYSWEGQALLPYLIAEKDEENSSALLTYNVFGNKQFEQYRIWQGTSSSQLSPLLLTPYRQATLWALPIGWNYFAVSAIDSDLIETELSNIDSVYVDWTGISTESESIFPSTYLYPNPASNIVNVEIHERVYTDFFCEFFDISGRLVLTSDTPGQISISNLASGLYTVRISGSADEFTKSLIVLR